MINLPDDGPVSGCARHLIAVFAAKGGLKLGHVHNGPDGAVLAGRVRVGLDLLAQGLGPNILAAQLGPAQKETLLGRKAVVLRARAGAVAP